MTEQSLQDLVDQLDDVTARRLLADAAMRDEETGRAVRLAAAGPEERLEVLRVEVDSGLRTAPGLLGGVGVGGGGPSGGGGIGRSG